MSRLTLPTPRGFRLRTAVCSYGYFLLAPNRWLPDRAELLRPLRLDAGRAVVARIAGPHRAGPLRIDTDARLTRPEIREVKAAVSRMLRLDEPIDGWRRVRPREAARRGFDRLFRSPSLFEDMVKTITGCNVAWRNTITMNQRLCRHFGDPPAADAEPAFPTPQRLARVDPDELNRLARVGYRASRIVRLARRFADGELDPTWFENPARTTEELRRAIASLHGFGPYATANVLQLLGRYEHLPIDTETYRHFEEVHGLPRGDDPKKNHHRIEHHYRRYDPCPFLAYWFELWRQYERRFGDAWTWDRDRHAPNFTALTLQRTAAGR